MNYSFYDDQAQGKAYDLRLIRRLWPYLARHRLLLTLSFASIPVRTFLDLLPALVLATAIYTLGGERAGGSLAWLTSWFEPPQAWAADKSQSLIWLCGLFLSLPMLWAGV